jgi:hypothetical protein
MKREILQKLYIVSTLGGTPSYYLDLAVAEEAYQKKCDWYRKILSKERFREASVELPDGDKWTEWRDKDNMLSQDVTFDIKCIKTKATIL